MNSCQSTRRPPRSRRLPFSKPPATAPGSPAPLDSKHATIPTSRILPPSPASLNGPNQLDFLLENTDLPSLVNYLAVNVVDSIFNPQKNYYVHQNRFDEWMIIPWDRDFSYGHRWLGSGDPRGSAGPTTFLVTDERYEWGGSNNDFKGGYNRLFDAIFDNPETSEMFYRRLRTTMDTVLAPGALETRIEELRTLMKQDADLDRAAWGFTTNGSYRRFPQESFDASSRPNQNQLPPRAPHLFRNRWRHSIKRNSSRYPTITTSHQLRPNHHQPALRRSGR